MAECKDWTWPCLVCPVRGQEEMGTNWNTGSSGQTQGKNLFTLKLSSTGTVLPRDTVGSPSLEIFTWLDLALSSLLLSCDLMVPASSSEDARKGRMEGEGQKEHQAMKTECVRVHFFLHTAVKQGGPSELRAAVLLQQKSRCKLWKINQLPQQHFNISMTVLQFLLIPGIRHPKPHISLDSVSLDMPGEAVESPEQRTQWSKAWATSCLLHE